jgi:hypothetical protein
LVVAVAAILLVVHVQEDQEVANMRVVVQLVVEQPIKVMLAEV